MVGLTELCSGDEEEERVESQGCGRQCVFIVCGLSTNSKELGGIFVVSMKGRWKGEDLLRWGGESIVGQYDACTLWKGWMGIVQGWEYRRSANA